MNPSSEQTEAIDYVRMEQSHTVLIMAAQREQVASTTQANLALARLYDARSKLRTTLGGVAAVAITTTSFLAVTWSIYLMVKWA